MIQMSEDTQRYSINVSLLLFLLGFLLVLSIMLIFDGLMAYQADTLRSIMEMVAGIAGIGFVGYNIRKVQLRFSSLGKPPSAPRVLTSESCTKCDYSSIRPFKEGDYMYEKSGPCPKCNTQDSIVIKAIFLQSPPKG